ncbi:hypothetical protein ACSCBZ_39345 [Streptomyces niveiscabiei]|uniref:hypothetical protein n=1 Tax=Streptomyces niveiscabiei TaxID=164115 RepID=UPI0006EB93DD|nr:hypothetical protein [Streptomyces niveiscabiei]
MPSWLPGMRITADRITVSSAQAEDTTLGRTTASTTYTDASGGAFSASVVVPMSGIVMVSIRSTQRNSGSLNTITSWQGVGSVSGTVYSPNDNAALIWAGGGTTNLSLGLRYRLSGLTPGETLTVTTKHRVSGASTATFDHRSIQLEGAPA